MRSSVHFSALAAILAGAAVELLSISPACATNVVRNPGFDVRGSNGTPVTLSGPPAGTESAAAEWVQGLIPGGTFMTTEWLPSTDLLAGGGGQMLHFFTDSVGFGSSGCVVGQDLSPALLSIGSWGCLDVHMIRGTAHIGFVDSCCGGTFYDSGGVWIGPSGWQRVTFTNFDFATGLIEIQLHAPQGQVAEMFMDNACAFAREPGYQINWFTIDGGGGASAGGGFQISGGIGQPDAAVSSGGGYTLAGGFWGGGRGIPSTTIPRVQIVFGGRQLMLTWPSQLGNAVLQETPQLSPAAWTDVIASPADNGGERSVMLPTSGQTVFYRLRLP